MNVASLKLLTRRPPVIVAGLVVVTVLAFLGVNRLVNRFREQEKALARHLYEHGMQAQSAGQPERAVTDFRPVVHRADFRRLEGVISREDVLEKYKEQEVD